MRDDREAVRRRIDRRALLRIAGVAGLTSLVGVEGAEIIRTEDSRAAGPDDVSPLIPLRTYTDWRRTWDLITPLSTTDAFPRVFLLYDRAAGQGSIQTVDQAGAASELRGYGGWRTSWHSIVSSRFPLTSSLAGLVLYDRAAGYASIQTMDGFGLLRELRAYANWRTTWQIITPVRSGLLLCYDPAAGLGSVLSVDRAGGVRELRSYTGWRPTWSVMTAISSIQYGGAVDLLLFYDRQAGESSWFTIDDAGLIAPLRDYTGWQSSWTSLSGIPLTFFRVDGERLIADVTFFDQTAGRSVFFEVTPDATMAIVLDDYQVSAGPWTNVVPLGPNLILFYDRVSGRATFARTDAIPPTPTPTPLPTSTPRPAPTPTVAPAKTGTTRITLVPGENQGNWMIYTGRAENVPATASVTTVTNLGDKRISLTHYDRDNRRRGPIYVKTGQPVTDFERLLVPGLWEARIDGSRDAAPNRITLQVDYRVGS